MAVPHPLFESNLEAKWQSDPMKVALTRLIDEVKSVADVRSNETALFGRLCQEFVEQFP
jgi:hypothetical protein